MSHRSTQGEIQGAPPNRHFSERTFERVGAAIQKESLATPNGENRWDQTPEQGRQRMTQGTGAAIGTLNNQTVMSLLGDQFSQLIDVIKNNNVFANNGRYHDGRKVNVRGEIDHVVADQIPINLQGRSNWINSAELSLRTNGSGIQMMSVDENILSYLPGQTWDQAQLRVFTVSRLFEYSVVFHPEGADQLVEKKSVGGEECKFKIPSRILNALCSNLYYGAIVMLLLKDKTLHFLHQDVAKDDAISLLRNIKYKVNAVDQDAIDLLNHRLDALNCPALDSYHSVRNDLAELIQELETGPQR